MEPKAVDTPAPAKSDHSTLFQKIKKTFEFPKSSKSKESPAKEATKEPVEAAAAPAPAPEPVVAAPEAETVAAPVAETPPPAADSKPTTTDKIHEKVSEGKGFFNKVKKSFFTKSHSFSGSIPESKQGTAATSTPPTIAEVSKEAESVPVSTPPEIEVRN